MKKSFIILLFVLFAISIVSAQYSGNNLASGLGHGMNQLVDIAEQMFGPFFSAILGGGDMLFERILFLLIILAVVYIVTSGLDIFKENLVIIWIVSISIALLSTRFLI